MYLKEQKKLENSGEGKLENEVATLIMLLFDLFILYSILVYIQGWYKMLKWGGVKGFLTLYK